MLPHGGGLVVAMPAQQMGNLSPGHVSPNRMTSPVQNPGLKRSRTCCPTGSDLEVSLYQGLLGGST